MLQIIFISIIFLQENNYKKRTTANATKFK